jgi:hypothetical protein
VAFERGEPIGSASVTEVAVDFDTFAQLLRDSLPEGLVLENPGGGVSTIIWCDGERVCYQRGDSRLYIELRELHAAYLHFAGGGVTTRQLKDYFPNVFDSDRGGHNCHCTFFFLALQQMGLAGELWGGAAWFSIRGHSPGGPRQAE